MAHRFAIPTCAAVLAAATLLAGCTVERRTAAPETAPERFAVVSKTWREGFANNPTTSALIEDRQTGCLYSLAEGKGAAPLLTPDGKHAGCRSANSGDDTPSGYPATRDEPNQPAKEADRG